VPGRINEQDVQALRERVDIASVVGDYTALTRAGTRLKGLCPLHGEKTPSFTVDPQRGYFHCFGCGEGGDVYDFLMKAEALSFPEAVERVARNVGYTLRYEELTPGQRKALGRRTRLAEALGEAAAFYTATLAGTDGGAARAYLASRGIGEQEAAGFNLGWAPDAWDTLARHLLKEGFSPAELLDAGLVTQGKQGLVDRFRARVIYPIVDPAGRDVVAFGGRLVPGLELRTAPREGTPPKYINSPETEVYRKSRTLYGLNWARAEIQRSQTALVVEGYMDVIGLHLAGARNAVATCGTALTAEHFALLERHAPRVVLALDADDAGFAAADRARALAEQAGVREVAVLALPQGKDPADLAGEGPKAVTTALRGAVTAVEFQIAQLLRTADTSTPEAQVDAYRRTFPLLATIPDRFLRYRYVRDVVAPLVKLNADLIERDLDAHAPPAGRQAYPSEAPAAPAPPGDVSAPQRDPQMLLERLVLQTALQRPDLLPDTWTEVHAEDFRAPASRMVFEALARAGGRGLEAVLELLPDDDARRRVRALALSEPEVHSVRGAEDLIGKLRAAAVERQIVDLHARLDRFHEDRADPELRSLERSLLQLRLRRKALLEGATP
jgi:DNA primase